MKTLSTLTAAIASSYALALSDGTPVEFVKVTSKDNIQVRVPTSHDLGAEDPLRIFRRDGSHYKGDTDLTLVVTNANADAAAPAAVSPATTTPAAGNDNDTTYVVNGNSFGSLDEAKDEAIDIFRDTGEMVDIIATTTKVVGRVGFIALAA